MKHINKDIQEKASRLFYILIMETLNNLNYLSDFVNFTIMNSMLASCQISYFN